MTSEGASMGTRGMGTSLPGSRPVDGETPDRLTEAASDVAGRAVDTAQQQVSMRVNGALSRAGDMLEQVANAIRQGGEQIRDQMPEVAQFTGTAADRVDDASSFLRTHDMDGVVREAESFARRQPALFIGGGLVLGLLASRVLKASPVGEPTGSGGGSVGSFYRGAYAGYTGTGRDG